MKWAKFIFWRNIYCTQFGKFPLKIKALYEPFGFHMRFRFLFLNQILVRLSFMIPFKNANFFLKKNKTSEYYWRCIFSRNNDYILLSWKYIEIIIDTYLAIELIPSDVINWRVWQSNLNRMRFHPLVIAFDCSSIVPYLCNVCAFIDQSHIVAAIFFSFFFYNYLTT